MSSNNGPSPFNAANLIDEGALPVWMRPERGGDNPPMRPASFSAPNTDESSLARGISAGSLIDQNALPSWMRQNQGEAKDVPSTAPRNVSASSLVEPDSLPEWMRNVQPQGEAQAPMQPKPQMPQMSAPLPSAGQPAMPAAPSHGFSARDLVDPQALPAWMTQQGGRESTSGTFSSQSASPTAQQNMPASSLLDPNAMPSWMRESNQGQAAPQPQNAAASTSWQTPQPNMQQSGPSWQQQGRQQANQPTSQQMPNGFLAAPSLIDPNALPAWLRPANTPASSGAYGPPRVENVRVPSRPRGEQGPQEGSEVAANVFASMLGVASAAPNFPAQQGLQGGSSSPMPQAPTTPQTPGGPNAQSPMPMAGMAPAGSGPYTMNSASQPTMYGAQSMNNTPQNVPPRGYPGNNPTGMNAMAAPGMPQSGMQQPGMPQSAMGAQQMPMGSAMMGEQSANDKAAKHGILETIRSWFFRS